MTRVSILLLWFAASCCGGEWMNLLESNRLDAWQVAGLGVWTVLDGGILVGQCDPAKPCNPQSWLYTRREFTEYDLSLEYWLRLGGNSGVSIGE